jgi:hypothetical protein
MGANAQTAVPAFTAGQVLTAAQMTQVNTGIPVFASSTERDAAFGGAGEKTLAEGQYAFLEDTNETQVYDGAAWAAVGGGGGLVFISRTTIGSAVSSVTVSGAFSADYDSYRIILSGGAASTTVSLQMLIGGLTTGYYYAGSKTEYGGASPTIARAANGSLWLAGVGHPNFLSADIHVHNPFTTTMPSYSATGAQGLGSSSGYTIFMAGFNSTTASQTDFVLQPNTGTMTGGTIDVYGYAKA